MAIAVAEAWLETSEVIGRSAMESVMHRATKILRLKNEIVDLSSLSEAELEAETSQAFELARQ